MFPSSFPIKSRDRRAGLALPFFNSIAPRGRASPALRVYVLNNSEKVTKSKVAHATKESSLCCLGFSRKKARRCASNKSVTGIIPSV
jgi:hypothetical protein